MIETVKHEIKKRESGFLEALLSPLATSIVQPVISSVVKGINGRDIFSFAPSFKQYRDY